MTELVGFKELTPYRGGWCGNEVLAESFSHDVRNKARDMTFKFGEELRELGYRGYFELDFLRDLDSDELYLGEVNPRVTGASAMTNLAAFAHADAPLFLFHLLEWADVDFELDVEELNARWSDPDNIDSWGQLVIKHTADTSELITSAPKSGIWQMNDDGTLSYVRMQTHRRTVGNEKQAFFLRISKEGDYKYEGADLGILITPGRLMTEGFPVERPRPRVDQRHPGAIRVAPRDCLPSRMSPSKLPKSATSRCCNECLSFDRSPSRQPGDKWQWLFRAALAKLSGVVLEGGCGRAAKISGVRTGAAATHARVAADL